MRVVVGWTRVLFGNGGTVVQLGEAAMGAITSTVRAIEALKRFESLPRSEPLREALAALGDEMERLLQENERLRDTIVRQEIRLRQSCAGR